MNWALFSQDTNTVQSYLGRNSVSASAVMHMYINYFELALIVIIWFFFLLFKICLFTLLLERLEDAKTHSLLFRSLLWRRTAWFPSAASSASIFFWMNYHEGSSIVLVGLLIHASPMVFATGNGILANSEMRICRQEVSQNESRFSCSCQKHAYQLVLPSYFG